MLIAGDTRNRGFARDIGSGEWLDDLLEEALLVIEHIMGNAEPRCDVARVVDILSGAACALAVRRLPMVIELHRVADHVVALGWGPRLREADAGFGWRLIQH